ncbi:MAG: formimidoylglutamase [Gammaproteobacteria bacterium RIFCSPHIGHO2_12_FULL_43_28]|nr:MAG: formimidoylglutamase [Gammaproteobacteria bacterium RIFCSPHIGHO2_12_FULL_43_28]
MSWESRYLPGDPLLWQRSSEPPSDTCFSHHMVPIDLMKQVPEKTTQTAFAFVGFKCDEGVQRDLGRTGAKEGPAAIRQRLARLPLQKTNIKLYDAGNVVCADHDLEASQASLAEVIKLLLDKNIHPLVLGGGHEMAFGHYQGIAKAYSPQKRLGIINFDAHFDLNRLHPSNRGSATTAFYQIAIAHEAEGRHFDYNCIGIQHVGNLRPAFDIAKEYNVKAILADDMHEGLREKCSDFADRVIDENDYIFISLSLDVFAPAFAPGVSSIQPLGLYPWHLIPLLRQLAISGKVVSYEIAEHVPRYDIDHRTAKLAATLLYEIIHHHEDHIRP